MKPTQRDWSECSNPSNQSSKLQNQIFEILSANPLQTNQSKPIEKSKGKISFDPTEGNLFVISLKKIRGRGKKKRKTEKIAHGSCEEHVHAHALLPRVYPSGLAEGRQWQFYCILMQAYLQARQWPRQICNRPRQICRCNVLADSRGISSSPRCDRLPTPVEAAIFDEQVALSILPPLGENLLARCH